MLIDCYTTTTAGNTRPKSGTALSLLSPSAKQLLSPSAKQTPNQSIFHADCCGLWSGRPPCASTAGEYLIWAPGPRYAKVFKKTC